MGKLENRVTKLEQSRAILPGLCTDQERAAIEQAFMDSIELGDWSVWENVEREHGIGKCHAVWKEMMSEVI